MKKLLTRFGKTKTILAVLGMAIVLFLIYRFSFGQSGTQYQFVTVKRGMIAEEVNVTGNTTAVQSANLGFQSSGMVAAVRYDVGARVSAGASIASLDTRDLSAQLAQAQAGVDAAVAKLHSLQAGAQPADIQASQAAAAKASQDLSNMYTSVPNTLSDAYAKANDAVRSQVGPFFTNPDTSNPHLTFTVNDSQILNDVQSQRVIAGSSLTQWQGEIAAINSSSPANVLDAALQSGANHIGDVKIFLNAASKAIVAESGLDATTVVTYKADVTAALNESNTANGSINTLAQNIASQKITVQQTQAQLDLKKAGSTQNDIDAQKAAVAQAQANADAIQVNIAKASIISPISGIITQQDAKVGQIATPGTALVTVISDGNLEIDANVPETDIGKIAVGNSVNMTLDAFPNETFTGKVFYINPGQTTIQGVVNYKVKVSFDKSDPRIKSGLTANLTIRTQQKNDALVLPQFAVLQNDQGAFVETLVNGAVVKNPVTLGIHDSQGNVEIASGTTEGEQVLNIGLKQGA